MSLQEKEIKIKEIELELLKLKDDQEIDHTLQIQDLENTKAKIILTTRFHLFVGRMCHRSWQYMAVSLYGGEIRGRSLCTRVSVFFFFFWTSSYYYEFFFFISELLYIVN